MFDIWCHQCVPFCMIEYTVSRRHDKTWNLKPWAKWIHWFMLLGSSRSVVDVRWACWASGKCWVGSCCCCQDCGCASPCSAETPPLPTLAALSLPPYLKIEQVQAWKDFHCFSGKVVFAFIFFFNPGYLVSVSSGCVTNPCFLSSLIAWASCSFCEWICQVSWSPWISSLHLRAAQYGDIEQGKLRSLFSSEERDGWVHVDNKQEV